jgi:hypothetical protein
LNQENNMAYQISTDTVNAALRETPDAWFFYTQSVRLFEDFLVDMKNTDTTDRLKGAYRSLFEALRIRHPDAAADLADAIQERAFAAARKNKGLPQITTTLGA